MSEVYGSFIVNTTTNFMNLSDIIVIIMPKSVIIIYFLWLLLCLGTFSMLKKKVETNSLCTPQRLLNSFLLSFQECIDLPFYNHIYETSKTRAATQQDLCACISESYHILCSGEVDIPSHSNT